MKKHAILSVESWERMAFFIVILDLYQIHK
jgi:hypothetical protein